MAVFRFRLADIPRTRRRPPPLAPSRSPPRSPPHMLPAARVPVRALMRAGCCLLAAAGGALTPIAGVASTATCPDIVVAPASLPPAAPGAAYSQTITASGGLAPYTFVVSAGALPPGLSLDGSGLLSDTPSAAGGDAPHAHP